MTKPQTKEQAEFFADGYMQGRADGIKAADRQLSYAKNRVKTLARWRKYAIDRLGVGPEIVAEIDRKSKERP